MLNLSIKIAKILTYSTLSNCGVVSNKRTGRQKTPSNCWSHQIGGYLVKMKSIAANLYLQGAKAEFALLSLKFSTP